MDREAARAESEQALLEGAARKFGAARAEALRAAIGETAGAMADVTRFTLDEDLAPAFYAEADRRPS